jgi:capsular exopolysaccharide synthesis family protein
VAGTGDGLAKQDAKSLKGHRHVQHDPEAFNLERIVGLLRRRLPLIIVCVVVVAGASYAFSRHQPKKYTATATVNFASNPVSQAIAGLPGGNGNTSAELAAAQAQNVESTRGGNTAIRTAAAIGHGLTPGRVLASIEVTGRSESPLVEISATTSSPTLSARIANTYANQFQVTHEAATHALYTSAITILEHQLASLTPSERLTGVASQLESHIQSLQLVSKLNAPTTTVTSEATPPANPSSPHTKRTVILGAIVGLVLALVLVFALERFDRRIRVPQDLEAVYRQPLLGAIPQSAHLSRTGRLRRGTRTMLPPAEAEWFSLIRARLRFLNIRRELRTLIVASAEEGEGKTMVARNLAEAAAALGSRVLLIEADLRNPSIGEQLGIQPGPGLSDVLIGAVPLEEAVSALELDPGTDGRGRPRTLWVLPAGGILPPNPAELLESEAAVELLGRVRPEYDLVVVDTPPLTVVSDALPLLPVVDGIVIVGRVGSSRHHAADRLRQLLVGSDAPILGVIANGARSSGTSVYPYAADAARTGASDSLNGVAGAKHMTPTGSSN